MKNEQKREINFEEKLWQAADKLRNNMDAAEYKHVVLGLIFLKYISDAFYELHKRLSAEKGADPEDVDEYRAENVFYVPKKARWDYLQKNAKQPTIGQLVDDAMDDIEKGNPSLKRVFDPCCGSGGMFVQSEKFVQAHGGRIGDIAVYGQESNQTTWRLCKMNLAIRGIDANIAWNNEGSFLNDAHKDLKADFVIANPPFNDSDWKGELLREDIRWKYDTPPTGNANFAWVQHFIYHLSPTGNAGFVLANGSMSSNTSGEGDIRKSIIEADLVDCMVALPSQLFYNTMIPACLWFIARDKKNGKFRNRRGQILFIDARNMGVMIDRRHRELTDEDIAKISGTYHAWRAKGGKYKDEAGFCKSAKIDEIRKHDHILTPGRYVGAAEIEEDGEVFEEKMKRLAKELSGQFKESDKLETEIKKNLNGLGFKV